jgi:C-methyltransferase C-terminal domain/Methyltransferase domain
LPVSCPVCGGDRIVETVRRERLPAMQNYVHRTRESALSAPEGSLVLAVCRTCGFAWNDRFDPWLLAYDDNYDNTVPSPVMRDYYGEIASYLVDRYEPGDGLVVDVGSGDGTFLRTLLELAPAARGLGIDPALDASASEGRLELVKDLFSPELIDEAPALVVSRHVLEHIPQPVEFLRRISPAGAPSFFEVPDLEWIVEHHTFWDFCYEHCNYFTAASFSRLLVETGFEPVRSRTAFGDQYLWLEAKPGDAPREDRGEETAERLLRYAEEESARISAARELLQRNRAEGRATVVWGMATKGVMFVLLTDPDASLVDVCVDVNPNKQGCYVPLTAHPILAPETLRSLDRPLAVLVMNENYRAEIERTCAELGLDAKVTTAEAQTI